MRSTMQSVSGWPSMAWVVTKTISGTFALEKTLKTFRINQKLITVRPTYLLPAKVEDEEGAEGNQAVATTRSKFRQTLKEVIGPSMEGKDWREEG